MIVSYTDSNKDEYYVEVKQVRVMRNEANLVNRIEVSFLHDGVYDDPHIISNGGALKVFGVTGDCKTIYTTKIAV